jgi:hypothetical protein
LIPERESGKGKVVVVGGGGLRALLLGWWYLEAKSSALGGLLLVVVPTLVASFLIVAILAEDTDIMTSACSNYLTGNIFQILKCPGFPCEIYDLKPDSFQVIQVLSIDRIPFSHDLGGFKDGVINYLD